MSDAKLHVMDHPLILHKISMLRSKDTNTKDFRELINEIALLIGCEATRDLPVTECSVTTPVAEAAGYRLRHDVKAASGTKKNDRLFSTQQPPYIHSNT